jgi:hypothetical protein
MNKRNILIRIGIFFITFYLILFFLFDRKGEEDLSIFISTRIEGVIVYVHGGSGGESFKLDNSKKTYNFISNMGLLNNYTPFSEATEIGDSVFKPSFADTLVLIKKSGQIYRFTFKKSYKTY